MDEDSKLNITKKKNDKTFVAESLDNNAPVKEIIDILHSKHRKHKVYSYYCQVLQQCVNYSQNLCTHMLCPGHPLNAFSEEWDGGLNSGYFETFAYKSLMPKYITTKLRHMDEEDPLTSIMHRKNKWNRCWLGYKTTFGKRISRTGYEWLTDDIIHCPEEMLEMAKHWENNPDVYFDSYYNWYYSGHGNMHLITLYGEDYLLHSILNCVYLSPFNRSNLTIDYDNEINFKFTEDTKILETVFSNEIIAIRMKNKVTILKICESDNTFRFEKLKNVDSKLPFTGISFDEYHKNILYITTIDYKLTIVNIDRMRGRSKQLRGKIETLVNNWSRVIGSERAYFTHVTKDSLTLYDKRTNNAFERWTNLKNIIDNATCNNITVAKYCKNKPAMYIGTNHHIFLMDMRYNKVEDRKLKAIQRWTHGMQCVPTYMSINDFEKNKELITITSQWCEDMCIFSNYADRLTKSDVKSVTIPYRPPSVFATLNEAQQKMLCLDIHNPIQDRLALAITGQVVVEQNGNYSVLMQNTLGDITSHSMCPKNMMMFFEDDACEHLDDWSKMYRPKQKDFKVTKVIDIRNVWKSLKKVPDTYVFGENKFITRKGCKFNEQDIVDTFENEDIDPGLIDIWTKNNDDNVENAVQPDQTASQLFFSCD